MSTAVKRKLSGSTDGRGIKVAATATPGTTIHTAIAGVTAGMYDELWLWAVNAGTTARKLTIEWGGVANPDDTVEQTIQPEGGLVLVVPGLILQNSLVVKAFAASANEVIVYGFANQVND